ncbi:MAG: two-component sensor histidine kinase [Crocinitomix sp.]|jgi:two-component sensor histidine kinase
MQVDILNFNYPEFQYFDEIQDGIIIFNLDGIAVYTNGIASELLDIKAESIIGSKWSNPLLPNLVGDPCLPLNIRTIKAPIGKIEESIKIQRSIIKSDNKELFTKWSYTKIYSEFILCSIRDFSEEQILAEKLEKLKQQNTVLCQEVHHRVKNNMQIVISLLNLQFRNVKDVDAIKALSKSKDRMIAITCIQDYLSHSENLYEKCFGEYLNKLVYIIEKEHKENRNIELEVEFAGRLTNNNHLVSLGLIICELVVNAYKHAFKFMQEGKVTVSLDCTDLEKVVLNVNDNGSGFASPLDMENPQSLGYEIIILLVHQIGGSISLTSNSGSNIRVIYYQ